MRTSSAIMGACGLGAAAIFFFDRRFGRYKPVARRGRDVQTLTSLPLIGLLDEARSRLIRRHVYDASVEADVQSRIAPLLRDPNDVHVSANNGIVTLRGVVRTSQVCPLLAAASRAPNVCRVENELHVSDRPQPVKRARGVLRVAALAAGGSMTVWGLRHRGTAAAVAGAGLMLLALSTPASGEHVPDRIEVQKTLLIHAPLWRVFEFWSRFENFPRFMPHLREVRIFEDGTTRWVAVGPAGVTFSWDAKVTRYEPNKAIGWRTTEDSEIENEGCVSFEDAPENFTRVRINISYTPPAGAIGHALAILLGYDVKSLLDQDLLRMKSLLEDGRTRAIGHKIDAETFAIAPAQQK